MLFILIFFIFESKGYFQICLYADGDSSLYDFNITCILKKKLKKKREKNKEEEASGREAT